MRTGLEVDPGSLELLELQRELGVRRTPVVGFLDRGNPLNRLLGGMRHLFVPRRGAAPSEAPPGAGGRGGGVAMIGLP